MAFVAGGTLGSGDKAARVADYCMDVTETTAGAYALCVQAGACSEEHLRCDESWTFGREDMLDHPINCVSWQDADRYCQFAGKRLPTFEEWEWAAQGRDEKRRFSWGDGEPGAERMCWSRGIARLTTCAVGGFPQSRTPQGIDDLFGNVWEWLAPAERNGSPNVARGGSWQNDSLDMLEGENAGAFIPSFVRNEVVGFRCVYDGEKPHPPAKAKASEPPAAP